MPVQEVSSGTPPPFLRPTVGDVMADFNERNLLAPPVDHRDLQSVRIEIRAIYARLDKLENKIAFHISDETAAHERRTEERRLNSK